MWLCCFGDANVGGLGCEFLVLLGALGVSMRGRWFVRDDGMSRVVSYSGVGSKALRVRLRLPVFVVLCFVCGHIAGCWTCLRWCGLGVCFREVYLVWLCCFGDADVGGGCVRF